MRDWDYEVSDYLLLMIKFLDHHISVDDYRRSIVEMAKKRTLMSEGADIVVQRAYGDADDYDDVVQLPYTIGEAELRERVAGSVKSLEHLFGIAK